MKDRIMIDKQMKKEEDTPLIEEIASFVWENKAWWLVPLLLMLLLAMLLVIFASSTQLSPFVYALF